MYSYKDILKVSMPIVLGLLAQNIIQITSTIFLGRVGEVEFGAVGLAGIYYIAIFMVIFGFSIGAQIMISRRNGEKDYKQIGNILIQGVIFLELLALALYFFTSYLSSHFLPAFMKSQAIYEAAEHYLDWRTFGFFISSINVMFRAFYVGIARTKVLTMNAVVMAIVNTVADYLLIFGKFGFPEMGVAGAAIAALLAEISSVIFFIIYTYKFVDLEKYGLKKPKFDFSIIGRILKISIFTMIQYAVSMSTWFIFFLAIENHGELDLAITNVIRSLYMIFFIPMNALSTTANTLVGNTIGAGKIKDVLPLIKRIVLMNLSIILVMVLITLIAPRFWISLIASANNPDLVQGAVYPLLVLAGALPVISIGTVLFNSISGTGNTFIALVLETVTMVFYVFAIWFVVIHKQSSVAVCWTVEYVYWGLLMIMSFIYLKKGNWQAKKI